MFFIYFCQGAPGEPGPPGELEVVGPIDKVRFIYKAVVQGAHKS